jgi:uncharacterized protein YdbL (DUF1318 family)
MIESALIKYGLMALAVVAIVGGVYAYGDAQGNAAGYKHGWDDQQSTIDKMVTDENKQRTVQNQKIADLEAKSMKDSEDLAGEKMKEALASTATVTQYKTKYVQIAASCGWAPPTVSTINSLLSLGVTNPAVPATGAQK